MCWTLNVTVAKHNANNECGWVHLCAPRGKEFEDSYEVKGCVNQKLINHFPNRLTCQHKVLLYLPPLRHNINDKLWPTI